MIPLAFRGPKDGRCNICGEYGKLTEDHTPPKGCFNPGAFEVQRLNDALNNQHKVRKVRANTGLRFRSLCAKCNNEKLGGIYDPALIAFTNQLSSMVRFRETLPPTLAVQAEPQKIMRAVYGHIAAAAVDAYGTHKDHEHFRDWFLNGRGLAPAGAHFHYWLYPFKPQVIVRGFAFTPAIGGNALFVGWLMKFYPVAFLIVMSRQDARLRLPDLRDHEGLPLDAKVDLAIDLRSTIPPNWPELDPGENGLVFSGDHALRSTEARRRRR